MRLVRLAMLAGALAACGGDDYGTDGGGGCTPTATQVCMTASAFNPTSLTITTGTTVMWRNGSGVSHTVTSNPGAPQSFDSNQVAAGGTFSRSFNAAGTYQYHCNNHVGMTGTVQVN